MDLAENDICCRAKHNAISKESVFFPIRDFLSFETHQVGLPHVWKVPSDPLSDPALSGTMYGLFIAYAHFVESCGVC